MARLPIVGGDRNLWGTVLNDQINFMKGMIYDVRNYVSDTTGATDMTTELRDAIAALPEGATLYIPAGAVVLLSGQVACTNQITLTGYGEYRWNGGVGEGGDKAGILLLGDGSVVDGPRLTCSNLNGPVRAIRAQAHDVTVQNCYVDNFQNGIDHTFNGGEWSGFICTNNIVVNVWGDASGEDNGIGIISAGADALISYNLVRAKPGVDTWIGIVLEGLSNQELVTTTTSDGITISNTGQSAVHNIVEGNFRRAIHTEGNTGSTVAYNYVVGFRWWGIVAWNATNANISNNQVIYTSNATVTGAAPMAYADQYCGILGLAESTARIKDNIISMLGTNWTSGIALYPYGAAGTTGYTVEGNTITAAAAKTVFAIKIKGATGTDTTIRGNHVGPGFYGLLTIEDSDTATIIVDGNRADVTAAGIGTSVTAAFGTLIVSDNTFIGVGAGSSGLNLTSGALAIIKHNTIINTASGVVCEGVTASYAPDNTFINVSGLKHYMVTSTTDYGPA